MANAASASHTLAGPTFRPTVEYLWLEAWDGVALLLTKCGPLCRADASINTGIGRNDEHQLPIVH